MHDLLVGAEESVPEDERARVGVGPHLHHQRLGPQRHHVNTAFFCEPVTRIRVRCAFWPVVLYDKKM